MLRPPPPVDEMLAAAETAATAPPPLSPGGRWVIAAEGWSVESAVLSDEELAQRWDTVPTTAPSGEIGPEERELLAMLSRPGLSPTVVDGLRRYDWDRSIRLRFWIGERENRTRLWSMQLSAPIGTGQSQWVSARPAARGQEIAPPSLLPLPPAGARLFTCLDANDRPVCEMLRTEATGEQLAACWRAAGWTVVETGPTPASEIQWLCRRQDRLVHVWGPSGAGPRILLCQDCPRVQ